MVLAREAVVFDLAESCSRSCLGSAWAYNEQDPYLPKEDKEEDEEYRSVESSFVVCPEKRCL